MTPHGREGAISNISYGHVYNGKGGIRYHCQGRKAGGRGGGNGRNAGHSKEPGPRLFRRVQGVTGLLIGVWRIFHRRVHLNLTSRPMALARGLCADLNCPRPSHRRGGGLSAGSGMDGQGRKRGSGRENPKRRHIKRGGIHSFFRGGTGLLPARLPRGAPLPRAYISIRRPGIRGSPAGGDRSLPSAVSSQPSVLIAAGIAVREGRGAEKKGTKKEWGFHSFSLGTGCYRLFCSPRGSSSSDRSSASASSVSSTSSSSAADGSGASSSSVSSS